MTIPGASPTTPFTLPFTAVAVDVARRASLRLMEIFPEAIAAKGVRFKGPTDLVTRADHEVEALIADALGKAFPDHGLMAEEGTVREGSAPPRPGETAPVYRWIVDPLDGTTNFAHGVPWFGVSIALEQSGRLLLGVVAHPVRGEVFVAERGRGAWRSAAEGGFTRLAVSSTADLGSALLATGHPPAPKRGNHFAVIQTVMPEVREIRIIGSAALHLAGVAAGWLDGFWEPRLNPWDVGAGILLVEEAGGRVTDFAGGPPRGTDIVATNGLLHDSLLSLLAAGPM